MRSRLPRAISAFVPRSTHLTTDEGYASASAESVADFTGELPSFIFVYTEDADPAVPEDDDED